MLYKNTSGQKLAVYAHNTSTNQPQTGDSANITTDESIDGGALTPLTGTSGNPIELGSGIYIYDLTQAESNGNMLTFISESTTSNVVLEPVIIYTAPSELSVAVTGLTAPGTADGLIQVKDATSPSEISDYIDANSTVASETTEILADTSELQANQGNWLTANATTIATAVWNSIVENGKSAKSHLNRIKSILGGNSQLSGTQFLADDGTTIETTVSIDASSNRTFS